MSGKLGIMGAYNRPNSLTPMHVVPDEKVAKESNSAKYAKLEKECKRLKTENKKMMTELDDVRAMVKQLVSEASHEKFDERRINLIKMQMIQLERQIALMNEALGSRQTAIFEVENSMAWLADKFRSYITAEVKGPLVPIARSDLTSMVEITESSRIKLFKSLESSNKDACGKVLLFLNPFLGGNNQGEPVSLLDICEKRMDHLNLRHVAQLESKLCVLYKELIRIQELFQDVAHKSAFASNLNWAEKERTETSLLKVCVLIRDAADDLLALSLLCPSSPWPVLKRPLNKQVPVERITSALPALPRGKQEEVTQVLESCLQVCNHRQHLLEKEKAVLREELAFHRSVYDLQMQYTQTLFDAVKRGYGEFENSAKQIICEPIKAMLEAYKKLKRSASEEALREFLSIVKENEAQLSSVVDMFSHLSSDADESGPKIFTKFGEEFVDKINSLVKSCQKDRDKAMKQKKEVKDEQSRKDLELQHVLEELEAKYQKEWVPKQNTTIIDAAGDSIQDTISVVSTRSNPHKVSCDLPVPDSSLDTGRSSLKSKKCKDDPTVLRSFLDDDGYDYGKNDKDNADSLRKGGGTHGTNSQGKAAARWIHDFSGEKEEREVKATETNKPSKVRQWKPNKEWCSDFSGLTDRTGVNVHSNIEREETQNTDCDSAGIKFGENVVTSERRSQKDKSKIKKPPLPYEPNLTVAKRTLTLQQAGGQLSAESKQDASGGSITVTDRMNSMPSIRQRSSSRGRQANQKPWT